MKKGWKMNKQTEALKMAIADLEEVKFTWDIDNALQACFENYRHS